MNFPPPYLEKKEIVKPISIENHSVQNLSNAVFHMFYVWNKYALKMRIFKITVNFFSKKLVKRGNKNAEIRRRLSIILKINKVPNSRIPLTSTYKHNLSNVWGSVKKYCKNVITYKNVIKINNILHINKKLQDILAEPPLMWLQWYSDPPLRSSQLFVQN